MPGKLKPFITTDTEENEDENVLRYPMKVLNALSHGAALQDDMLSDKKVFDVMLLRNQNSKRSM